MPRLASGAVTRAADRRLRAPTAVVAIEPRELESAARVSVEDSLGALQSYLALYGAADEVDLPPAVRGRVTAAVQDAAHRLYALSDELDTLGRQLRRKAAQARRADGDLGALLATSQAPLRFTKGEDHWLENPAFFLRHSKPVDGGYRDLDDRFHRGNNDRARNLSTNGTRRRGGSLSGSSMPTTTAPTTTRVSGSGPQSGWSGRPT
jgi:hypothetical protein